MYGVHTTRVRVAFFDFCVILPAVQCYWYRLCIGSHSLLFGLHGTCSKQISKVGRPVRYNAYKPKKYKGIQIRYIQSRITCSRCDHHHTCEKHTLEMNESTATTTARTTCIQPAHATAKQPKS